MMKFDYIDGESRKCSEPEYSPLCICRSSYRHSINTDLFLATLSLSQCNNSRSNQQCRQSQFHPPSFHLTQLIPKLANLSHCFQQLHCLQTLKSVQRCKQCYLTSSLVTHNNSYYTNRAFDNLPTDACFYLCQYDTSCGFLCLNQHVTISINCNICQGHRKNITCRCIKPKQSAVCLQSSFETTTEPWMQKRGFPAAAYLLLLILFVIILVITIKLIYYQLDRCQLRFINHSIFSNQGQRLSRSSSNVLQIPPT
ncbi:unnamed protein product [Adineta steineri]|uniref:Uncharacterized protein n=1 Tax=Adineta steineri TaxID=433720 RepID=A0A819CTB7_9BILA|nr:unnamed protein product [Adineta steineri]